MYFIKSLKTTIVKLWYVMDKKRQRQSLELFFVILIGSFLEMLGVSAILPFVNVLMSPDTFMNKGFGSIIRRIWIGELNYNSIIVIVGCILIVVYILKNIFLYGVSILQRVFKCKTQKDLALKMLKQFINDSYENYINSNTSEVINRIDAEVFGAFNVLDNLLCFFRELFTTFLIGAYLLYVDTSMALSLVLVAGLCFSIMVIGLKKRTIELGEEKLCTGLRRATCAYQAIMGLKEIKITSTGNYFISSYEDAYDAQNKAEIKNSYIENLPERLIESVCIVALIGIICVKVAIGSDIQEFIPKLSVFAVAAIRLLPSVSRMTRYINGVFYNQVALDKVYANMQNINKILKNTGLQDLKTDSLKTKAGNFKELSVKEVTWIYKDSKTKICDKLSFSLTKGESMGIIGSSGSGKSTLMDVVLGLYKPIEGEVTINDVNIHDPNIDLSEFIGYVPQSVFLLDDTIRNNVAFGKMHIDDVKVWEALEKAQLKDFVERLPMGLETRVGERGIKFSGGQRQRVAIARALYNDPEIIILDEATSALDNETEKAVMESIDALQGYKTLIIVAHRLTTIKNCDKIYEIKDGKAILRQWDELK